MRVRLLLLCMMAGLGSLAQDKTKIKFGDVTEKDLSVRTYSIDSSADAVVIADIGSSRIEGNNKGSFSLVYRRYRKIHILNKNAYSLANVTIPLYYNGDAEETLDRLKAVTYNLQDGKLVQSEMDKSGIFHEKVSRNMAVKKFTLPNVKEGSIIEYEYTIVSDFLQYLRSWEFQGPNPRLRSEYEVSIPEFLGYVTLTQGYRKFDTVETKDRNEFFTVAVTRTALPTTRSQFSASVTDKRYIMTNVPGLKEEQFTSSIDNHIQKIEFQLSELRQPLEPRQVMESWEKVSENMMKASWFGADVTKDNPWMDEIIASLNSDGNKQFLFKKIYNWVRDNITCNDHSARYTDQTLKNLYKSRSGNVAEVNLFLTALLLHEGFDASPVLLSTRSNGAAYAQYPILSQYNYVICRFVIGQQTWYLDASEPFLGFGKLPVRCYNGHARVLNKDAEIVNFVTDSLTETKTTSVFIVNDEGGRLVGSLQQVPGYFESLELRERISEKGRSQLEKDVIKNLGSEFKIEKFGVDSIDKLNESISMHYDFDIESGKPDFIYFNPLLTEARHDNPFKPAERHYPVEMPFTIDETYTLQMEVPNGYTVEELPKSMLVKLNEADDGVFEYRISQSGNNISFRSRIRIVRSYFDPEEYTMLRDFFGLIIKKQSEQIVFKRTK